MDNNESRHAATNDCLNQRSLSNQQTLRQHSRRILEKVQSDYRQDRFSSLSPLTFSRRALLLTRCFTQQDLERPPKRVLRAVRVSCVAFRRDLTAEAMYYTTVRVIRRNLAIFWSTIGYALPAGDSARRQAEAHSRRK